MPTAYDEARSPSPGPSTSTKLLALVLCVVSAALVWAVTSKRKATEPQPVLTPSATTRPIVARGDLANDEQATIDLFAEVSASVVQVAVPQGTGSGFVWDDKGHIVTNYHVIKNQPVASITLSDGNFRKAIPVGVAPDKDLAVLRVQETEGSQLSPLLLGESANLMVGQKAFAIGNPFGLDQTLTTGIISGLGREVKSLTGRPIRDCIQTDAAINAGNSGGPLLDSAGRVIGINTQIYSPTGTSAGIGFAVPVDTINRIVPQLIRHGKVVKPGLGVILANEQLAQRVGIRGVVVRAVPKGTAADRAGIRGFAVADFGRRQMLGDVIVGVDGTPIANPRDLYLVLDEKQVGDTISVSIARAGKKQVVQVTLQALN